MKKTKPILEKETEKILKDGFGYYIANRKDASFDCEPLLEYCLPRLATKRQQWVEEGKRLGQEKERKEIVEWLKECPT